MFNLQFQRTSSLIVKADFEVMNSKVQEQNSNLYFLSFDHASFQTPFLVLYKIDLLEIRVRTELG